ncbi:MAG: hypothetical protein RLZZ602_1591 [Pseudomonadota bacterium]|jgi:hypothetical protein
MFARISNGFVVEYPIEDIRRRLPDRSLPADLTKVHEIDGDFFRIYPTDKPVVTGAKRVVEITPEWLMGTWRQAWRVEELEGDDLEAYRNSLMQKLTQNVQNRLDVFAKTRGYDSILSATTYVDDPNPKFAQEGEYCKNARSQTWKKLYEILDGVLSGEIPEPSSYSDIEPLLPDLIWPN